MRRERLCSALERAPRTSRIRPSQLRRSGGQCGKAHTRSTRTTRAPGHAMITSEPTRLVPGATGRPSARYFPCPTSHPRLEKRRVTTASRLRRCSLPRRSSRASALAMQRRSTGGGIHLLTRTGDFTKRCQDEKARIDAKLESFSDLPDEAECGIIDMDGNKKTSPADLEQLDGGRWCVKLILKDPVAGVDIRGIGSGVAEINEDGTAKEVRLGSYPKPRGRVPLNKSGEPAEWCSKTRMWLGVVPKKSPAKKRKKTELLLSHRDSTTSKVMVLF